MSEELKAKVKELTNGFLGSLKGKAKEFYDSRQDVKDRVASTTQAMAEITLALVTETDATRIASLKDSIDTGLDTLENDVAALLQGVKNEGSDWLMAQLRGLAGFAKDALPTVLKWALKFAV